jgi:hypothetical protein
MAGGGWYRMHRGWTDTQVFSREPFTDREAFHWSVENAAYQEHQIHFNGELVTLARGQIVTSIRRLAETFRWSVKRVRSYMNRLSTSKMWTIESTHRWARITICNYEKYQQAGHSEDNTEGQSAGTLRAQSGHTIEEGKEGEEGKETNEGSARYAFFGRVIKLNARDLDQWRASYHAIPDIMAELLALDAWLLGQSEAKRKGWFHTTIGALNRKHQEILERRSAAKDDGYDRDRITV